MSGIPTFYNGTRFRSRIEARWAAMFDHCGWRWEYEPFDGEYYQPDFVLLGHTPVAVEVKADMTEQELRQHIPKITEGLEGNWAHDILIVGGSPYGIVKSEAWERTPAIGLLGELGSWQQNDSSAMVTEWTWAAAPWWRCRGDYHGRPGKRQPGQSYDGKGCFTFNHDYSSYVGRPCGHYWGGHGGHDISTVQLDAMWARARNATQWKAS